MKLPNEHQAVMPYLMLNKANEFYAFTRTVFNAEETLRKLRDDEKTIMHSEIQINGNTIMYCDATDEWKPQTANLFIYVEDADITFKKAQDAGAEIVMPLNNQDYGRTCGVKDPFGNTWWITATNE
ncbi:VOC family protein [Mariniflexile litorale]|uniref:VOC family protein n=1 Tax=Mariniflexile litorale TaxID=3045158 RepID=A0AAU7EGR0_9FLAO|nr:VOC family protein [Mariniflexile sp. KMM 9835]MDQ8212026.1 VOC family protein [Mariniflexile sp. KMM 9835]